MTANQPASLLWLGVLPRSWSRGPEGSPAQLAFPQISAEGFRREFTYYIYISPSLRWVTRRNALAFPSTTHCDFEGVRTTRGSAPAPKGGRDDTYVKTPAFGLDFGASGGHLLLHSLLQHFLGKRRSPVRFPQAAREIRSIRFFGVGFTSLLRPGARP